MMIGDRLTETMTKPEGASANIEETGVEHFGASRDKDPGTLFKAISKVFDVMPQGFPAEVYVYGVLAVGAVMSAKRQSSYPLMAAAQGLAGATAGSHLASMSHRLQHGIEHGSVKPTSERAVTVFRFMHAALAHHYPSRDSVVHPDHHTHADDLKNDPHPVTNRLKDWLTIGTKYREESDKRPEKLERAQENTLTNKRSFDRPETTAIGVIGTHMALGEATDMPVRYRLTAAAIHIAGIYVQAGTYAVEAHLNSEPEDLNLSLLADIVTGSESRHGLHHKRPGALRHADVDVVLGEIKFLEQQGLLEIDWSKAV